MKRHLQGFVLSILIASHVWAATDDGQAPPPTNVKYRAGKDLNFEQLIIEGQLKRPEMSVVTGDNDESGNGLLRLRENFIDRMALESGEELP